MKKKSYISQAKKSANIQISELKKINKVFVPMINNFNASNST